MDPSALGTFCVSHFLFLIFTYLLINNNYKIVVRLILVVKLSHFFVIKGYFRFSFSSFIALVNVNSSVLHGF